MANICKECGNSFERKVHTGRWGTSTKVCNIPAYYCSAKCGHRAAYKRKMLSPEFRLSKLLGMAKNRALTKELPFNLTLEHLLALWEKQEARCALSAVEFVLESGEGRVHPHTVSIDRIIPELGYTQGNVRLVSFHVNVALSEFGEQALLELAAALLGASR